MYFEHTHTHTYIYNIYICICYKYVTYFICKIFLHILAHLIPKYSLRYILTLQVRKLWGRCVVTVLRSDRLGKDRAVV